MNDEAWVVAVETSGLTVAEMLANELNGAGIPARVEHEGAGRALGLTVGILGTARVMVPESYLEEAQEYLDVEAELDEENVVICPHCDAQIVLSDEEWEQDWFICPACQTRVELDEIF